MYFVVRDDDGFAAATQAYCRSQRDRYGLTMTVLMDPDNKLGSTLFGGGSTNDLALVLSHTGAILLNRRYAGETTVWQAVDDALAAAP
jgi:hypothetical protein